MIFSTPVFLFLFLPAFYVLYLVFRARNVVLLLASLAFYYWGEAAYTIILVLSILLNYWVGRWISAQKRKGKSGKTAMAAGIAANLIVLTVFKYAGFLVENVNVLTSALDMHSVPDPKIHLPLGISFFTFQAISYLIDVKRGDIEVEKNAGTLALYISLFPQLVAGPIVRYSEIADRLHSRKVTLDDFAVGVERFVVGLSKKVLIADQLGPVADSIFNAHGTDLTSPVAWLGVICFTLQIYYDFSGYSDMAIGLGRMLGFKFPENFMHPYKSRSIQEFWRRWHMTLSRFFRDYLYIPLGGSRQGKWRTFVNLWAVFVLCGLWHGASWAFVVWGAWHGLFLVLERTRLGSLITLAPIIFQHLYVILVVMIGWVFFRSIDLQMALNMLSAMFAGGDLADFSAIARHASNYQLATVAVGIALSWPVRAAVHDWLALQSSTLSSTTSKIAVAGWSALYCVTFVLALAAMTASSHEAFIYFRF